MPNQRTGHQREKAGQAFALAGMNDATFQGLVVNQ